MVENEVWKTLVKTAKQSSLSTEVTNEDAFYPSRPKGLRSHRCLLFRTRRRAAFLMLSLLLCSPLAADVTLTNSDPAALAAAISAGGTITQDVALRNATHCKNIDCVIGLFYSCCSPTVRQQFPWEL